MGFNPEWLNKPRKRQSPEGILVRQILGYLRAKGFPTGKLKTMGVRRGKVFCYDPFQWRGVPDVLAFIPQLVFIEAKSATGKQSEEQKSFQDFCNKAGVTYLLIRSLEELQSAIK